MNAGVCYLKITCGTDNCDMKIAMFRIWSRELFYLGSHIPHLFYKLQHSFTSAIMYPAGSAAYLCTSLLGFPSYLIMRHGFKSNLGPT